MDGGPTLFWLAVVRLGHPLQRGSEVTVGEELETLGLFQGLLPSDGEAVDATGISVGSVGDQLSVCQLIIAFCLQLIKTVNLDSKKNYIFGFHPYGKTSRRAHTNTHTIGKQKTRTS